MTQPCMGVVIISVIAVIIVFLVILLTTSPQSYHRCPSGVVPWDARNYSNDPKRVGSYGGVAALRRVVPEQDVERWLSEQDTYTLHKPMRRRFKRRCVVVGGPNQQWQADLVDMSRLKKINDGTTFILTVIDVFSKLAW